MLAIRKSGFAALDDASWGGASTLGATAGAALFPGSTNRLGAGLGSTGPDNRISCGNFTWDVSARLGGRFGWIRVRSAFVFRTF